MSTKPELRYRISIESPERHIVGVTCTIVGAVAESSIVLRMAAWSPGSYLIRDYARYVRDVRASTAEGPLTIGKIDKQSWRVDNVPGGEFTIHYTVYGYDLTVRTNHIDDTHAFLHGPATFLYVEELRDVPHSLEVRGAAERGWTVTTGLRKQDTGYVASGLDEFLDCPIHAGAVEVREFEASGKPAQLVVWGYAGGGPAGDLDSLATDTKSLMETHASRFDGVPYDDYSFILMLSPGAYGGLEHRNSSANLNTPDCFATKNAYIDLLELLSHEFFHTWNGKRMAPPALHRFDYTEEAHTRCLWVMEGLTSYYDRYSVLRSGLMTPQRYFEKFAEEWLRLQATPGRQRQSLEDSSFDAWIKLYKPDASNVNTTVSYYLKGGFVAMQLDLDIRHRSEGRHSLRDVLTAMWHDYCDSGGPYPEDVQPLFERATGLSLEDFFARYIRGTSDPDLAVSLAGLGLELQARVDADSDSVPWLGIVPGATRVTVGAVIDDSPAHRAGLSPGDEIIALNGVRIRSKDALRERLRALPVDAEVSVALFRRSQLHTVEFALEPSPPNQYKIAVVDDATDAQRTAYTDWSGCDFPESSFVSKATAKRWL